MRSTWFATTLVLLGTGVAFAQSTTTTSSGQIPVTASQTLATQTPAKNVKIGAVSARSPGKIIEAANARHAGIVGTLSTSSFNSGTAGSTSTGSSNSSSSSSSSSSSNSNLQSLLSTLLASNTGGNLNSTIASLLSSGALSGLLSGSTATAKSTASDGLSPEVLAVLEASGIDVQSLFGVDAASSAKPVDQAQTATTQPSTNSGTNPTWFDRWTSTLLNTTFNSLTLAFSTTQFITAVSDTVFLPFFRHIADAQNPSSSSTSGTSKVVDTTDAATNSDAADGQPVVDDSNAPIH